MHILHIRKRNMHGMTGHHGHIIELKSRLIGK